MVPFLCIFILVNAVGAERVAVIVNLPDQVYVNCVTVPENTDAYQAIEETDLNVAWSYYGQTLGHALCGINETGCPSTNCFCNPSEYWNFYTKQNVNDAWTYSQVGFDGGGSCNEHYCAVDGGMIGLSYGAYGTEVSSYSFDDVCCSLAGDYFPCGTITLSEVVDYINEWQEGSAALGDVVDLIDAWGRGE